MPAWLSALGLMTLATLVGLGTRVFRRSPSTGEAVAFLASCLLLGFVILAMTVPLWFPGQD